MGRAVKTLVSGLSGGLIESPEAKDLKEQHQRAQNIAASAEKEARAKAELEEEAGDAGKVILGKRKRKTSSAIKGAVKAVSTSAGVQK